MRRHICGALYAAWASAAGPFMQPVPRLHKGPRYKERKSRRWYLRARAQEISRIRPLSTNKLEDLVLQDLSLEHEKTRGPGP